MFWLGFVTGLLVFPLLVLCGSVGCHLTAGVYDRFVAWYRPAAKEPASVRHNT